MGNLGMVLELMKLNIMDIYRGKLETQKGEDKPNKNYYDPRKWLRAGQRDYDS